MLTALRSVLFSGPGGEAVTLTPASGEGTGFNAIRSERVAGELVGPGNVNRAVTFEIPYTALSVAPRRGDSLVAADGEWTIAEVVPVGDVAAWLCGVEFVG